MDVRKKLVNFVKNVLGTEDLTLYLRRKRQNIEKIFYHKKYSAEDVVSELKRLGVKPGRPVIIHSAMHNFYNYQGTADELIEKILDFLGPDGTLCMPAFPYDKRNERIVFDVRNAKSSAGYLTEAFRKRPGVLRSLNQLESVCAFGKDAEYITSDHINSLISFDEHSPFYKIGELNGYSVNLGMPKWFIGTGGHVCEALLFNKLQYFKDKFSTPITFTYINEQGEELKHTMMTRMKHPYVRSKNTNVVDKYFDSSKYGRTRLSNIWITVYDMKYLYTKLSELAVNGITIFKSPKYYI